MQLVKHELVVICRCKTLAHAQYYYINSQMSTRNVLQMVSCVFHMLHMHMARGVRGRLRV